MILTTYTDIISYMQTFFKTNHRIFTEGEKRAHNLLFGLYNNMLSVYTIAINGIDLICRSLLCPSTREEVFRAHIQEDHQPFDVSLFAVTEHQGAPLIRYCLR